MGNGTWNATPAAHRLAMQGTRGGEKGMAPGKGQRRETPSIFMRPSIRNRREGEEGGRGWRVCCLGEGAKDTRTSQDSMLCLERVRTGRGRSYRSLGERARDVVTVTSPSFRPLAWSSVTSIDLNSGDITGFDFSRPGRSNANLIQRRMAAVAVHDKCVLTAKLVPSPSPYLVSSLAIL